MPAVSSQRVLVAAAAAVACVSAVLLRRWDRAAGQRVAELTASRDRVEWRAEERLAELEGDVEESREIRHRLEGELRAKRSELARLRGEHAALLRRYATAETERARVLESRRMLAIEASAAPLAIASAGNEVSPGAYLKAAEALRNLPRNAARQQARRTVEEAGSPEAEEHHGRHTQPSAGVVEGRVAPPLREHGLVPAVAAAVLPYAQSRRPASRAQGGFDFFGVNKSGGEDAYGTHHRRVAEEPEVIDLTAHDDTEQLDVRALRAHS